MKHTLLCAAIIAIAASCEKSHVQKAGTASSGTQIGANAARGPVNNYVSYETWEAVDADVTALKKMSTADVQAWEDAKNVVTMNTAFNQVVAGEQAISDHYYALQADSVHYADSLAYYKKLPDQHCALVKTLNYMLSTQRMPDGSSYYDMNIWNENLAWVSNTRGILKVGDWIYQNTKDYVKYIDNGDATMISTMVAATVSDPTHHIVVVARTQPYVGTGTATFVRSCDNASGKVRIIVYQNWTQNQSGSDFVTDYKITLRALQRRLWGAWWDNYGDAYLYCAGQTNGNSTNGFNSSNNYLAVNYVLTNVNVGGGAHTHTFTFYWPWGQVNQSSPQIRTNGTTTPQLYSSQFIGTLISSKGNTNCTTTY